MSESLNFNVVNALPFTPNLGPTVLVVEDNRRQRAKLVNELGDWNVLPLIAVNAHEAINIAAAERPELILMDGLLPGMHGFEAARYIRHLDSAYRPFIVLTTAVYKGIRYENEAKLKWGIDLYVHKPVQTEELARMFAAYDRMTRSVA